MVAHGGGADFAVDDRVNHVSYSDGLPGDDLVGEDALHRPGRAFHFGEDGLVIGGVEPAGVADLAA